MLEFKGKCGIISLTFENKNIYRRIYIMKRFSDNKFKNTLKNLLICFIGSSIASFGATVFYLPNKIVGCGVSGISTILYYFTHIPPGVSFAVINIILLLI